MRKLHVGLTILAAGLFVFTLAAWATGNWSLATTAGVVATAAGVLALNAKPS